MVRRKVHAGYAYRSPRSVVGGRQQENDARWSDVCLRFFAMKRVLRCDIEGLVEVCEEAVTYCFN